MATANRALFERLRRPEAETRSIHHRTDQIAESIRGHLSRLLNTRHGDSPALPRYGIPAFEAEHAAMSEGLQREIERSIVEFEPRLQGTRVRAQQRDPHDPLCLRFEIHARLITSDETVHVRFTSQIDARGEWKVAG